MKKIILTAVAILAVAGVANARSIVGSQHDMTTNVFGGAQTDQICVYCHTPHNAAQNIPLWNRVNPSVSSFQLYKDSITLTAETKNNSQLFNDSVSTFCMSCHDGVTKVGAIKNLPAPDSAPVFRGDAVNPTPFGNALGTSYAAIGNDGQSLKNDHPIGFDFSVVASTDQNESQTGGIHTIAEVKSAYGISNTSPYQPFYNSNNGARSNQMECASCHKVHDPGTSFNFLRKENAGSALCLACHIK